MSINVHAYRGKPVPYFEFSDEELRHAIRSAKTSIAELEAMGTERAKRSARVLRKNINMLRRVLGGAS